jgi:drug/metabolite transporter (DMT)-like permease
VTAATSAPASETAASDARRATLTGVAFAMTAALSYGSSQVISRYAVTELAPPLVGTTIALFWGTLGFALLSARNLRDRPANFRRGALYFVGAGFFSSMGVLLMFTALSRGQVVILSPVLATNPLFTLLFAAAFLRGVERITRRHALGTALVVAGVVVLSVF